MIVVFDSNIWLSELGLRSGAGAAARFYLKQKGARVAIPEVVRLEVEHNLRTRLLKHIEDIRSDFRQLLTVFGKLPEIVLPGPDRVEARIEDIFASIQVEKIDIPFSLASARSSFLKTVKKIAPSHSKEQFKDGVIWGDCLALLETDDVVLVTNDKAFYQDQQYPKGLARELVEEAATRPHRLQIFSEITGLLESVRATVPLDVDALQRAFFDAYQDSIYGSLDRHGLSLGERTAASFNLFATDDPDALFIDFELVLACMDARNEGRSDAKLHLKGDGSYIPEKGTFGNLRNFGEYLQWRQSDGCLSEMRNYVAFMDGLVLGHRQVSNVTRYPLHQAW